MDALIVLCHPREESLCHAVTRRCEDAVRRAGGSFTTHDLYRERFDPVLSREEMDRGFSFDEQVQLHGREVAQARLLVFVHPDWWGQPPALLKGWIDRVFRPGVAYDLASDGTDATQRTVPLMSGKKARVFCTSDTENPVGSLELVWTRGVFEFCGIRDVEVSVLANARLSAGARRQAWLEGVDGTVDRALARPQA